MKSKQALVPKLRFRDFEGTWQSQCYSELSTKIGSGSTPTGGAKVYTLSGIPFIRSQNVNQNKLLLDDLVYISKEIDGGMKGSRVQANDILLNITGASIGRSCVTPSNFTKGNVNQHVCIIRPNNTNSPHFIQAHLASFRGGKLVLQGQAGGGREGLNFQSIRRFKLRIPTLPEQEKIAGFLTSVDDRIDQLKRKKSLLQDYKKGVMQKLFSQELRFKDDNGKPYPDWEEKKLGEVASICSSKRVLQEDWKEQGVPFYRTREIISLGENIKFRSPIFIEEKLYQSLKSKYGVPMEGDILVSGVGTIGRTYIVKKTDKFYFKDGNVLWIQPEESISSSFLDHSFKTRYIRKQLSDNASITTVATFTIDGARKTIVKLPTLPEQTKIANFLSTLDQKIEQIDTQITQTQTFKKGLLQQMFV